MKIRILEILSKEISDSEKADLILAEVNSTTLAPIEDRREVFISELAPYVDTYGKDMINSFFRYWVECSGRQRKMRFEKEKTFEIARRLERWRQNSTKFSIVGMLNNKNK